MNVDLDMCTLCYGTGKLRSSTYKTCPDCYGLDITNGDVIKTTTGKLPLKEIIRCIRCNGKRKIIISKSEDCFNCHGYGYRESENSYKSRKVKSCHDYMQQINK